MRSIFPSLSSLKKRSQDFVQPAACLGALGVVYGDIGTSPIYTLGACLSSFKSVSEFEVLGTLSLITWLLILVVSFKYVLLVTRADNRGEGGVFALLSLIEQKRWSLGFSTKILLLGAALLYGDGVITPAISVLSAVEGLNIIHPSFAPMVVPSTLVILSLLFYFQYRGSGKLGKCFGPIMLVWFLTLALLGIRAIYHHPLVLRALNPCLGIDLLIKHPHSIFILLGSAILAVTGAEALYADMGHFGRKAINKAWHSLVLPSLVLNYMGQGAKIIGGLDKTQAIESPFFSLASSSTEAALLTLLSTLATIIASQSIITGVFSLTKQAIQLGFFPRLNILHTNASVEGQIYIPFINSVLALSVMAVVVIFGSSASLTQAYGTAVTGTMLITSYGLYQYCKEHWQMKYRKWALFKGVVGFFIALDLLFFGANVVKFFEGAYIPLLIAAAFYILMYTWKRGRLLTSRYFFNKSLSVDSFIRNMDSTIPVVPGVAVFMAPNADLVPAILLHHIHCNKIYYKNIVLMTVGVENNPRSSKEPYIEKLGPGVYRFSASVGYMESVNIPNLLQKAVKKAQVPWQLSAIIYYFSHELTMAHASTDFWSWQKNLFSFLLRCSRPVYYYFKVPAAQMVEIGIPIEL